MLEAARQCGDPFPVLTWLASVTDIRPPPTEVVSGVSGSGGCLHRVEGCIGWASDIKGGYDFGYDFVVGIYRCILIVYDDMICKNYNIDVDNTNF